MLEERATSPESVRSESPRVRLENPVNLYRDAAAVSTPIWGDLTVSAEAGVTVTTKWAFTDVDMDKKINFQCSYRADFQPDSNRQILGTFRCVQPATEVKDTIVSCTRSRGPRDLRAIHKELLRGDRIIEYIEVWDHSRRLWVYDADATDLHGRINTRAEFGAIEFARNETKLLFVAEKKMPRGEFYFGAGARRPANPEQGSRFRREENWGEELDGVVNPVVVVVDIPKSPSAGLPLQMQVIELPGASLGQATFTPDGKGIVVIGMANGPYKLGAFGCNNRPQRLYHYEFTSKTFVELGDENKCIYSPRFTTAGHDLLYLQTDVGGPHMMACELIRLAWSSRQKHVIISVPESPKITQFPGLYVTRLLKHCTSVDGNLVYLETQWRSVTHILQVDLRSETFVNITATATEGMPSGHIFSWELLSVNGDFILAACSTPTERPNIVVGRRKGPHRIVWSFRRWTDEAPGSPILNGIIPRSQRGNTLSGYQVEILELRPDQNPAQYFEAIYVHPKDMTSSPYTLLVHIHGGPHCASTTAYSPIREYFLSAGYSLLMVNYRGSTGYGEVNLRSLPGHVGDYDVKDVQKAVCVVKSRGLVNEVVLLGRSHGGFIAAHLIGQYPDTYTAACLMNPTIDFSMFGPTDIPDWFWYEGGCNGSFRHDSLPTPDDLVRLHACSPIAHANKITAPCYLFLGGSDRRIDKGQGLKLYKYLQARGVDTRCNVYNDNHQLACVANKSDVFICAVRWFDEHCNVTRFDSRR